ncbi:MAG: mechanosensitive ion channel [Thermovirga sp.]
MEASWKIIYTLFVFLLGAGLVGFAYRGLIKEAFLSPGPIRTETKRLVFRHLSSPLKALVVLAILHALLLLVVSTMPENIYGFASALLTIATVAAAAWFIIEVAGILEDALLLRFDIHSQDNLLARKVHTRLTVFGRLVSLIIGALAFSLILMNFQRFRHIATGLLASVGVVGIIVGLAAQRTVGSLLAGIQLAITQPIRVDDVLVVEGEWGRVEEISFTHVVVKIWDSRRLILPTTYFLEKPFQNWTRVSSEILGTVFLYLDYGIPLDDLRARLREFLEASPFWDGKVCALQVTDCSEQTMEVRALMSARDSGQAWDLRCRIREELLEYIRNTYPDSLPRIRLEKHGGGITTGKID